MNRKLKNTFSLVGVWLLLLVLGFGYIYFFQQSKIKDKTKELNELKASRYDQSALETELQALIEKSKSLDSILAKRKYIVPVNVSPLRFFDFINNITNKFASDTKIDIEYIEMKPEKEFFYYDYKITGKGTYNDFFQLVYAIEESRELKKIYNLNVNNSVSVDEIGIPKFLVSFSFNTKAYYTTTDRFMFTNYQENNLSARILYDVLRPLIRTEIPPNYNSLLDVQGARLLAIVPEGAFLVDANGYSYLLMEGDEVYLGYLTKIDNQRNTVKFVLNKGGIVETIELQLEKEILIPKEGK